MKMLKGRSQKRVMRGEGFFGDVWNGIKKAGNWIKDQKIISNVGNALGSVGVPYAGAVGKVAGAVGLGKRRKRMAGGAKRPRRTVVKF